MTSQQSYFALSGGLDQESAAIAVPAGRVIATLNHESVSRGYQRTQGYERYDGQPSPAAAAFYVASFTNGTIIFVAGQTVTGYVSGATALVLSVPALTSGAWNGTGVGTLILHRLVGTFIPGEALRVAGVTHAVLAAVPTQGDGNEDASSLAYLIAARDYARSLIQPVPGAGPVRGIIWYEGAARAWRDNIGATAGVMHRSSATGWVAPDLGKSVLFTNGGTYEIQVGDVVIGSVSGATGTVRTIVTDAGTNWNVSTATGTIVLDSVVGTFVAEELSVGSNIYIASITMAPVAYVFPPGGRYEFDIFNFYGTVGYERAYGVNGVGKAFEYDGSSVIAITTGMPVDSPFLVAAHKNHLFLGFEKGSLQHSDLGEPRSFTARLGAAELGMGHELTGIIPNATATLLVTTDTTLGVLTGNDSSDWLLEGLSDEAGAKAHSAQRIGQIIYLDNRGVRSVAATQNYGNFKLSTYTNLIQTELDAKRSRGAQPCASMTIKSKDQYLLFFTDGSGISIYFGRKNPEPMLFEYPFVVTCSWVAEVDGVERAFVGCDNGYVYELNVGTSFDGAEIEAFLQLPFIHQGGPRVLKRYHKAVAEIVAGPGTQLAMVGEFNYGDGYQPLTQEDLFGVAGGGGLWGLSNWADFYWDSPTVANAESYLQGIGKNLSIIFLSRSATMDGYILQGLTVMFSPRGTMR